MFLKWVRSTEQDIKSQKNVGLEGMLQQTDKDMEIHPIQKPQNKIIPCHSCECPALWLWDLDHYYKNRKALEGCYTRMLRSALNAKWKTHMTKNYTVAFLKLQQKSKQDD